MIELDNGIDVRTVTYYDYDKALEEEEFKEKYLKTMNSNLTEVLTADDLKKVVSDAVTN